MDEDHALIERIAQGDEAALHTLYLSYRPRLYRYLWHQLHGDEQTVADLLQEIFLAIWRTAPQFRQAARVSTWIFQVAHNQMARVRGQATRMHIVPWDESLETLHTVLSAEDEVVPRLTLAEALGAMSPKLRETLELVYLQGFSLEEVGQIIGIPLGTVKSRINAARQTLFRALDLADTREENRS